MGKVGLDQPRLTPVLFPVLGTQGLTEKGEGRRREMGKERKDGGGAGRGLGREKKKGGGERKEEERALPQKPLYSTPELLGINCTFKVIFLEGEKKKNPKQKTS